MGGELREGATWKGHCMATAWVAEGPPWICPLTGEAGGMGLRVLRWWSWPHPTGGQHTCAATASPTSDPFLPQPQAACPFPQEVGSHAPGALSPRAGSGSLQQTGRGPCRLSSQ